MAGVVVAVAIDWIGSGLGVALTPCDSSSHDAAMATLKYEESIMVVCESSGLSFDEKWTT